MVLWQPVAVMLALIQRKTDLTFRCGRGKIHMFIRNIVVNIVQNNPRIVGVILSTKILIQNHLIKDIADCPGVGKVWPLSEVLCYVQKTSERIIVDLIPFLF